MPKKPIVLKNVREHNLKGFDLKIEPNQLVVCTGVSGSGKSSLVFDTIYVEGQRRFVESLSSSARRQIVDWAKPHLDDASGVTPTISIEQKSVGHSPRSTVGTMTEIYDHLRVLFARIGIPYCPVSGERVAAESKERIIATILGLDEEQKVVVLAPFAKEKKGEFREEILEMKRKGFVRIRVDGTLLHLDDEISLDGTVAHNIDIVIDRLKIGDKERLAESITQAIALSQGTVLIQFQDSGEERLYSTHGYSPKSGLYYEPLEPQDFSFNSPQGMCPTCLGLGEIEEFDPKLVIDPNLSISQDCCSVASSFNTVRFGNIYRYLAEKYGFSVHTPWHQLSEKAKRIFLYGSDKKWLRIPFVHPETKAVWYDHVKWDGVFAEAKRRYAEAKSEGYRKKMQSLMTKGVCHECNGSRLKSYPSAAKLGGKTIGQLTHMTIEELASFFNTLSLSKEDQLIGEELLAEIKSRLHFLKHVGLHYLTLDRSSPTLSGGEGQRVRLASQIGGGLVGITYVLDEPSIGLHQRDNQKLIETLKKLRDMGNTVLVVEHDEETILAADHLIDIGPGPGYLGGELLVDGSLEDLLQAKKSVTGAFLRGERSIAIPKKRRTKKGPSIEIKGAAHHNLKGIDVKIPLGKFVAITGVSGSGKSSLILDTLYPALSNTLHGGDQFVGKHDKIVGIDELDKVIAIDQSPIGRNPRSNPATYIKLFDPIRELFAELPEAKAKGFDVGQFSFNVKEGSCTTCSGNGMVKVDMDFLEDTWAICPTCEGERFDPHTLSVTYKGKSIADILDMEVSEALQFFDAIPKIKHRLTVLAKVGLDYIKLGQPSPTLSGGEAQRVKLAKELLRPSTGRTLYLLDEPTTGLHFADIEKLLEVLHHFVDEGNTVLVIEHNLDIIKTADWIIDLGPEGGAGGGQIVGTGTPEQIAKMKTPTGEVLLAHMTRGPITGGEKVEYVPTVIDKITVKEAKQNNLKGISLSIPRDQITVCCGPSGSGKSSLAFDTIYAEGQRRYIESLSPYARQFVKQMPKAQVGSVEGLSPAIAIEQKAHAGNPRSTIGTMTEIHDYLRVLYAHMGRPHNPNTGHPLVQMSKEFIVDEIMKLSEGEKVQILSPIEVRKSEPFELLLGRLKKEGLLRILLNGVPYNLDDPDLPLSSIPYDRKRKNTLQVVVDRITVRPSNLSRIRDSVQIATKIGQRCLTLMVGDQQKDYFLQFSDPETGESFPPITPKSFAFNSPQGQCPYCLGIGTQFGSLITKDPQLQSFSINRLLELVFGSRPKGIELFLAKEKIDGKKKVKDLNDREIHLLSSGSDQWIKLPDGGEFRFIGIDPVLAELAKSGGKELKEILEPLMETHTCPFCEGKRLKPLSCHVLIEGVSLPDLSAMPIKKAHQFLASLKVDETLKDLHETLVEKLNFLTKIGLHYLSLERKSPTLSGGETQRIRLARQMGSGLTGALYVLDEPTVGLHPHDTARLNEALLHLKALGNTLLLVEHDEETLKIADHLIDFGPKAGIHGGQIMAEGSYKSLLKNKNSLTGQYLSGKKRIPLPEKRRSLDKGSLILRNCSLHNLKSIDVSFPVKALSCVTGLSGSGKSTLIHHTLAPLLEMGLDQRDSVKTPFGTLEGIDQIDKLLHITQDPIGHTSRSDVGTYCELLPHIRQFFAKLPAAQMRGLQPRHFSFNQIKGMCTNCFGMGYKKVELLFMPAVKIECPMCKGMRLNPVSLEVRYHGLNFGEILHKTVDEAKALFEDHPATNRILTGLVEVGLGYLQLGQEMNSLSGGEAQRIKLSRELSKRSTGKTLYLLDEPTTGLHAEDIEKLLKVLHRLVDKGNTVIMIEHHIDMIANADWVIDLGPFAGDEGGCIVASGTPEEVAAAPNSLTAPFLQSRLHA